MKEQTTRTPPKLRILSAFLAVAMLLNLAAPLALADSVKCTVAGVELTVMWTASQPRQRSRDRYLISITP